MSSSAESVTAAVPDTHVGEVRSVDEEKGGGNKKSKINVADGATAGKGDGDGGKGFEITQSSGGGGCG